MLASLNHVDLRFGPQEVLKDVTWAIQEGECWGVIGRNGAGKSTVFKLLLAQLEADAGTVVRPTRERGIRMGHYAQDLIPDTNGTVLEEALAAFGDVERLQHEMRELEHRMGEVGGDLNEVMDRYQTVTEAFEHLDGFSIRARAESILQSLGFSAEDFERPVETLSGGQKSRVMLAKAVLQGQDLLLLDEPTNHLDFTAIEWLEGMLVEFSGALLFITHDRAFLDRVANRIIELDRGQLRQYQGNFSDYQRKKAEQLEVEAAQNRKFDKFWKQEEVWIRKGVEARRTRNEGRVLRLESLRRERSERRERLGSVGFALDAGGRSGQMIAEFEHVSHGYAGKNLIQDFSTRILRGDKLGLIGPNGAGKTTLIKLILGDLEPDSGRIKRGTRQEVAYFDQFRNQLDDDATLIDTISPGSDTVEIGGVRKHVIGYLEEFLFPAERARAKVSSLSGGERNRLLLARLFARPANILVLDEPTNDLDIDTLELLEQLLQDYGGTVILVSHDRAFLDNVVTQSIVFAGEGRLLELPGGYSDWLAWRSRKDESRMPAAVAPARVAPLGKPKKSGLSYKEQKELEALPQRIAALEAEQAELARQLSDPVVYADHGRATALNTRGGEIDEELLLHLARWEELEGRA